MSIASNFKFAQIEMNEIEGIRIKRTVESFIADHAYEYTFWKLTLEEICICTNLHTIPNILISALPEMRDETSEASNFLNMCNTPKVGTNMFLFSEYVRKHDA